jgi:hypothetical protein
MLINEFDDLWHAHPFRPFRMHLSDGRSVLVRRPQLAWHPPAYRVIWVSDGAGGPVRMVDLQLVTELTLERGRGDNGNGRKRK